MATQAAEETSSKRGRRGTDPNLAKQRENPLDSDIGGVKATFDGVQYQVSFEYQPALVNKMRNIEGAAFDKTAGVWGVPLAQYDALAKALPEMRTELERDVNARADIENIAYGEALIKMDEHGSEQNVLPMISAYKEAGKASIGELISVNSRYAAQLTGFGERDGAAFIMIHRLADLSEEVFKGDRVSITYDDKGKGKVANRQTLEEKLDASLGRYVDGVKVVEENGKYKISFDYNPTLINRIQRIDGVERGDDTKTWQVGTDKKEFVARAVNDMRKEVVADRADRKELEALAAQKIDGVKIRDAFMNGQSYSGKVVGANGRYALQHTGKEFMTLHRMNSLDEKPEIGRTIKISYDKGKGKIADKTQSRDAGLGR